MPYPIDYDNIDRDKGAAELMDAQQVTINDLCDKHDAGDLSDREFIEAGKVFFGYIEPQPGFLELMESKGIIL